MGEAAGDHRSVEQHGGGNRVLSSARWWRWIIVHGSGAAEARCRESRQVRFRGSQLSQVVKCMQGSTLSRRRCHVSESSCPSACLREDPLKLKRITIEVCMVFCELCPCLHGASWSWSSWVR
jgi:hypothetical protein